MCTVTICRCRDCRRYLVVSTLFRTTTTTLGLSALLDDVESHIASRLRQSRKLCGPILALCTASDAAAVNISAYTCSREVPRIWIESPRWTIRRYTTQRTTHDALEPQTTQSIERDEKVFKTSRPIAQGCLCLSHGSIWTLLRIVLSQACGDFGKFDGPMAILPGVVLSSYFGRIMCSASFLDQPRIDAVNPAQRGRHHSSLHHHDCPLPHPPEVPQDRERRTASWRA